MNALAALENLQPEFQQTLAKLGLEVVFVHLDGNPQSPVWKYDVAQALDEELRRMDAGELDSQMMAQTDKSYCLFFHVHDLATALRAIKGFLESMALQNHAHVLTLEPESGWRVYWPPTAELVRAAE